VTHSGGTDSNLDRRTVIVTEISHEFSQTLQANSGTKP
jgi:hypothetical protein